MLHDYTILHGYIRMYWEDVFGGKLLYLQRYGTPKENVQKHKLFHSTKKGLQGQKKA